MPRLTRRGQGTLEYVLVFAVIVIVLLIVGWVFREQVRIAAKKAQGKIETWIEESKGKKSGTGSGGEEGAAGEEGESGKRAEEGEGEEEEGGTKIVKPGEAGEEVSEEPGFSLTNFLREQRIAVVAGAVIAVIAILFMMKQERPS